MQGLLILRDAAAVRCERVTPQLCTRIMSQGWGWTNRWADLAQIKIANKISGARFKLTQYSHACMYIYACMSNLVYRCVHNICFVQAPITASTDGGYSCNTQKHAQYFERDKEQCWQAWPVICKHPSRSGMSSLGELIDMTDRTVEQYSRDFKQGLSAYLVSEEQALCKQSYSKCTGSAVFPTKWLSQA